MLFKKATKVSFLVLFLLLAAWGAKFLWITPYDLAITTRVMKKKERLAASSEAIKTSTHQIRQKVQKDIWFSQEAGERLHYKIQSDTSLLTLEPKGKKVEIIENLEKIKCWMQDKIYYSADNTPLQQLRFFEADQGTYRYSASEFDAQTVILSLFRMPGHEIPETLSSSPFIKGIARDVCFSVSGKTPKFQAKQFQAQLKGKEV